MLAGLVKAPSANGPTTAAGWTAATARMKYVLKQMLAMGAISDAQRIEAQAAKLTIVGQRTVEGCESVRRPDLDAGFFCEYVRRWWREQPAVRFGTFAPDAVVRRGGGWRLNPPFSTREVK